MKNVLLHVLRLTVWGKCEVNCVGNSNVNCDGNCVINCVVKLAISRVFNPFHVVECVLP